MQIIKLNHKRIRSEVIKEYLGERRAFAFSCGNTTRWLKRAGVNCVPIDGTPLEAHGYIDPETAEFYFDAFNATSGYLPLFLIARIAERIETELSKLTSPSRTMWWSLYDHIGEATLYVPHGSGELVFAFSFLYPSRSIVTVSSQLHPATRQDMPYPLTRFIKRNTAGHLALNHLKSVQEFIDYIQTRLAKPNDVVVDTSEAET